MFTSTLSLISELDGMSLQIHVLATLPPGNTWYPFRCIGGPKAGQYGYGTSSAFTGIRSPDRPSRTESPYRLRHFGPLL
jgi:hypothetical protein